MRRGRTADALTRGQAAGRRRGRRSSKEPLQHRKGRCDVQSPIGRFVTLMMAVPILVLASSGIAPGQTTTARAGATAAPGSGPATGAYMPPRTPDGQPD